MEQTVGLDEATRAFIDRMHAQLHELSHYQLLGVDPKADKAKVKTAYYKLVNLLHPDRHAGKQLGAYRAKMEQLFALASEAYATLSYDDKRGAYDAAYAGARRTSHIATDAEKLAKREAGMQAIRARFEAGKGKAKELVERARHARAAGDVLTAAECYRQALAYSPTDLTLKVQYEQLRSISAQNVSESNRNKATLEERFDKWSEAAVSWQRVVEASPQDAEAKVRLALALARAKTP